MKTKSLGMLLICMGNSYLYTWQIATNPPFCGHVSIGTRESSS